MFIISIILPSDVIQGVSKKTSQLYSKCYCVESVKKTSYLKAYKLSIIKHQELYKGIPNVTVWRVLRKLLYLKAYKLSIAQDDERGPEDDIIWGSTKPRYQRKIKSFAILHHSFHTAEHRGRVVYGMNCIRWLMVMGSNIT
jgi:hypothetical protein